jgi:NADH-quinone oxidoreductase subunit D
MEQGALTPLWWFLKGRELIWDILEQESGARMMHSFCRIGGMAQPPTAEFKTSVRELLPHIAKIVREVETLLIRNRIFIERNQGVGILSKELALSYGVTGPVLRSTGVDYDVRKAMPYSGYETYDFEVPIGHDGDNYDRFMVRLEEIRQSCRIIEQGLVRLADQGEVNVSDPRIVLPEKHAVYTTIEATIAHFKLIMEGIKVPPGEVYSAIEGGNGELGLYLVSDGSGTPYRVRCRPPCFFNLKSAEEMIRGDSFADIIATFGAVNMIGGECDR